MSVVYMSVHFDKSTSIYVGQLLGFPGCHSQGASCKELLENLSQATELVDSLDESAPSVYFDLGYPDPAGMARKSILVSALSEILEDAKLDEAAAATMLEVDHQSLRAVLRGEFRHTSESTLRDWIHVVSQGRLLVSVEVEQEDDGRWLAEVVPLASLSYGHTPLAAVAAAIRSGAVTLTETDFSEMIAEAKLAAAIEPRNLGFKNGQFLTAQYLGSPSPPELEQKKMVFGHITPSGANIFSELGFGPEDAAGLLKASDKIIAAKQASQATSVEVTSALNAHTRQSAKPTFVPKGVYRFKTHDAANNHMQEYLNRVLPDMAMSGFSQPGHYSCVPMEGAPKEHDLVELIATSPGGKPVGSVGVAVHVYANGEAFEVEFNNAAGYSVETIESNACRAVMLVNALLHRWVAPLSQKLGRPEMSILEDGLAVTDFSGTAVRIVFEDKSNLHFENAFFLGDVANRTKDKTICRVVVFTEHVGYHEFWVGPDDRIDVVDIGSQIVLTDRESSRLLELLDNPPPPNKKHMEAQAARLKMLLQNFKPELHGGEFPKASVSHEAATIQELGANPAEALAYFGETVGDGEPEEVWLALRRITAALDLQAGIDLNRDFKLTVAARMERDPTFAIALLDAAKALFLSGESIVAIRILRTLFAART